MSITITEIKEELNRSFIFEYNKQREKGELTLNQMISSFIETVKSNDGNYLDVHELLADFANENNFQNLP